MQKTILDLNNDVLKTILLLVVASSGGATDLAKTMAVSKKFREFRNDEDLVKNANFDNIAFPDLKSTFPGQFNLGQYMDPNGLLIKCAEAGNFRADVIVATIKNLQPKLTLDVLKNILLRVVASARGVADLGRAMTVEVRIYFAYLRCKEFAMLGYWDEELLMMANFDKVALPKEIVHFNGGLLIRCAEAGNVGAQQIIENYNLT